MVSLKRPLHRGTQSARIQRISAELFPLLTPSIKSGGDPVKTCLTPAITQSAGFPSTLTIWCPSFVIITGEARLIQCPTPDFSVAGATAKDHPDLLQARCYGAKRCQANCIYAIIIGDGIFMKFPLSAQNVNKRG